MTLENLTDATFEESLIGSETPVLVDFWAPWCMPCKQLTPILEQLSQARAGAVRIVKVNVDENPQTAARYGIRALPTLMIFKDGSPAATKFGLQSSGSLDAWITQEV